MQKSLLALTLAAAVVYALPAAAMTPSEYKGEKERVREEFSQRMVNCLEFSGMERARCHSNIRKERGVAMKSLKANYESSKEPEPKPLVVNP
jgi:hypothetical protein